MFNHSCRYSYIPKSSGKERLQVSTIPGFVHTAAYAMYLFLFDTESSSPPNVLKRQWEQLPPSTTDTFRSVAKAIFDTGDSKNLGFRFTESDAWFLVGDYAARPRKIPLNTTGQPKPRQMRKQGRDESPGPRIPLAASRRNSIAVDLPPADASRAGTLEPDINSAEDHDLPTWATLSFETTAMPPRKRQRTDYEYVYGIGKHM
ncbi:uncharacterized protein EV420DRAFT_1647975 [Desarmillaria tabescens]|uniref:Uncharacterized protein n=1 Tax=Armillaria tabescens TaxID=1929756 RepID=A0AA39JPH4_ARMTA|nr:uncharacterized protein EV420DRAFT_1647975 [Desarmillaria tabescens]KAK0446541.1 hypothetical protein EV420DRAFT_1647975 [Desarmillaria tabescens]